MGRCPKPRPLRASRRILPSRQEKHKSCMFTSFLVKYRYSKMVDTFLRVEQEVVNTDESGRNDAYA